MCLLRLFLHRRFSQRRLRLFLLWNAAAGTGEARFSATVGALAARPCEGKNIIEDTASSDKTIIFFNILYSLKFIWILSISTVPI